jgi:hypothetical protein
MTSRTTVFGYPDLVASDGADIWVASHDEGTGERVRASDGTLLGTWTGATEAFGVLVARGRIYVTGTFPSGHLYRIDPSAAPGPVTTLSFLLSRLFPLVFSQALAFPADLTILDKRKDPQ